MGNFTGCAADGKILRNPSQAACQSCQPSGHVNPKGDLIWDAGATIFDEWFQPFSRSTIEAVEPLDPVTMLLPGVIRKRVPAVESRAAFASRTNLTDREASQGGGEYFATAALFYQPQVRKITVDDAILHRLVARFRIESAEGVAEFPLDLR